MAHYGELIDPSYDPLKEKIYKYFSEYFENPIMTKLKDIETNNGINFSLYAAKIHCLLSNVHRYIMIFVLRDSNSVNHSQYLSDFRWKYLHTRTLKDNHNLSPQSYQARRFKPLMNVITKVQEINNNYVYDSENYPLSITLLPKIDGQMDYQNNGTIVAALETYNTIVSWK